MTLAKQYLSTTQASEKSGPSRTAWWRACVAHPGLGIRLGKQFYIPVEHVERVRRGETPAQIAAEARARAGAQAA